MCLSPLRLNSVKSKIIQPILKKILFTKCVNKTETLSIPIATWPTHAIWLQAHWKQISNPGQQDCTFLQPTFLQSGSAAWQIQRFVKKLTDWQTYRQTDIKTDWQTNRRTDKITVDNIPGSRLDAICKHFLIDAATPKHFQFLNSLRDIGFLSTNMPKNINNNIFIISSFIQICFEHHLSNRTWSLLLKVQ